jgi:carbonic anhydrase
MAINLSRSFARPCDILCDLTVDDVAIASATVYTWNDILVVEFDGQKPSLKFNGEGYTVENLVLKVPSWHTVEDIRADAEAVAIATRPGGDMVYMSLLLRTNTAASRSRSMLNALVPYVNKGGSRNKVPLGNEWSLTQMIPPEPAYYSYTGAPPWGGKAGKWVVFRSMGNIDPNDFALAMRAIGNTPSRIVERTQEVFFNDTQHIAGVPDGKAYMRCKRVKKKGEGAVAPRVTPVKGLAEDATKKEKEKARDYSWFYIAYFTVLGWLNSIGIASLLDGLLFVAAIGAGVYAAYNLSTSPRGLTLATQGYKAASWTRGTIGSWIGSTGVDKPGFFQYSGKTQAAVIADAAKKA